jgi:hypothetical protein
MAKCFEMITLNNIARMAYNHRFFSFGSSSDISDKYSWMPDVLQELFICLGALNICDFVPALKPFDPTGVNKRMRAVMKRLDGVFDEIIAERRQYKASKGVAATNECLTDNLLSFMEKNEYGECITIDEVKGVLVVRSQTKSLSN